MGIFDLFKRKSVAVHRAIPQPGPGEKMVIFKGLGMH